MAHLDLETELDDDEDMVVSLPELSRLSKHWLAVECGEIDVTADGNVTTDALLAVPADWLSQKNPGCSTADMNGDDLWIW